MQNVVQMVQCTHCTLQQTLHVHIVHIVHSSPLIAHRHNEPKAQHTVIPEPSQLTSLRSNDLFSHWKAKTQHVRHQANYSSLSA